MFQNNVLNKHQQSFFLTWDEFFYQPTFVFRLVMGLINLMF